ncbi:hypothetical protein ABE236_07010, partial [Priestia endophytica]
MALFEEQPIKQPVPHMKEEKKSSQESPFFLDEKEVEAQKRSVLRPFATLKEKRAKVQKEKPLRIKKLIAEIIP